MELGSTRTLYFFASLLLALMLFVLGFHSLLDPDLGWHLVGGSLILEQGTVPRIDPLGADSRPWIAYSWLAEVVFSFVYAHFGFQGLRLLQLSFVFFSGFSLYFFLLSLRRDESSIPELGALSALFASVLSLVFLSPMFHLRPQLLSVGFFALLLRELLLPSLSLWRLGLLTLVWVNIHVFWVFLPLALCLRLIFERQFLRAAFLPLMFFLLGLVSPYGTENLSAIFEYAFSHSVAYQLIDEFHGISPKLGMIFFAYCGALLVLPFQWSLCREKNARFLTVMAVMFALATLLQRKYLPFFGVAFAACLHLLILQKLKDVSLKEEISFSPRMFFVLIVFCLSLPVILENEPPLPESTRELIELTQEIPTQTSEAPRTLIYEGFDEGGWVGFALSVAGSSPRMKTLIDGRTLVMGEKRLTEYAKGVQGEIPFCQLLESWGADYAILRPQSAAWKILQEGSKECVSIWRPQQVGSQWGVLKRLSVLENPQSKS